MQRTIKALHRTAIPLRSIAAGELGRFRHGLDMAYSKNQAQVYDWGSLCGLDISVLQERTDRLSLQYSIKANKRTVRLAKNFLKDRFYLLNFDDLRVRTEAQLTKLLNFLGFDPGPEKNPNWEICQSFHQPPYVTANKTLAFLMRMK
jgi:hypothetical protein